MWMVTAPVEHPSPLPSICRDRELVAMILGGQMANYDRQWVLFVRPLAHQRCSDDVPQVVSRLYRQVKQVSLATMISLVDDKTMHIEVLIRLLDPMTHT
jgi:hypothetical protein